jgi:hypothetical protein
MEMLSLSAQAMPMANKAAVIIIRYCLRRLAFTIQNKITPPYRLNPCPLHMYAGETRICLQNKKNAKKRIMILSRRENCIGKESGRT